ncbi:putative protein YwqG [Patescibacteria group bacterium]|nr:putative protein YwqG [Patescibacteria group bacterium]
MKLDIELPEVLLPFKVNIEASIKPVVKIKAAKVKKKLSLWQSKFSGLPYFPKDFDYPLDSQGEPMALMAQLNFAEIPHLPMFPETGILQFFISSTDGMFGMNFDDLSNTDNFRVFYFSEVLEDKSKLLTDFSFLPEMNELELPFSVECALSFELQTSPMSIVDYQFGSKILNSDEPYYYDEEIYEAYSELFPAEGHKIGGYPFFTQADPRELEQYQHEDYVLLFQMDTDDENDIMWGDCGVATFFIKKDDLLNKDFSKVLYSWDCC